MKVGTAVVTRSDGRLALGRLGALCEQVIYNILIVV
jgi:delta-1-pyrroline-5-carboxylate synthetase